MRKKTKTLNQEITLQSTTKWWKMVWKFYFNFYDKKMRMSTGFLFKEFFTGLWISYHQICTCRYNLTESRHQPNPWSAFCVCSDSARAVPKQTSKPKGDAEQTQIDTESRPWFQKQTLKADKGFGITYRPVNQKTAFTNQSIG